MHATTTVRAIVLDIGSGPIGYALLISFWSNELGGELCTLDEIYVRPEHRGRGHARTLIERIVAGDALWPNPPVSLALEVSPNNRRARALYERLGFKPVRNINMRRLLGAKKL